LEIKDWLLTIMLIMMLLDSWSLHAME